MNTTITGLPSLDVGPLGRGDLVEIPVYAREHTHKITMGDLCRHVVSMLPASEPVVDPATIPLTSVLAGVAGAIAASPRRFSRRSLLTLFRR